MSESIKDIAITLIDAAYGCEFISKTALAEVQYLNKEYSFIVARCSSEMSICLVPDLFA